MSTDSQQIVFLLYVDISYCLLLFGSTVTTALAHALQQFLVLQALT